MASLHRVESGAGSRRGGVLDENLDLPKLLLYGSGIYSALTLALHPLSRAQDAGAGVDGAVALARRRAARDAARRACAGCTLVWAQ